MTKKFWTDWQKRIGETTEIRVYGNSDYCGGTFFNRTLVHKQDRILKLTFEENNVNIEFEEKSLDGSLVAKRSYTIHRKKIHSIKFQ